MIDILAQVEETFLDTIEGDKGGMLLVSPEEQAEIIARLAGRPVKAVAGSAGNTIYALARIGFDTAFLGKIGNDANGAEYKEQFAAAGGDVSKIRVHPALTTGTCLALITPDGERTMRTNLGAAIDLTPDDVTEADFEGVTHLHVEGYMLDNEPLLRHVLELAYEAECTVSINLASFEVVRRHKALIEELLPEYVNIVFANEDEARVFADGETSWQDGLEKLAGLCQTVCVTLDREGAVIRSMDEEVRVSAKVVESPTDTTSAGDTWAAGFLYGYLMNLPLELCGQYGAMLASEVVQVVGTGAVLPQEKWEDLIEAMA